MRLAIWSSSLILCAALLAACGSDDDDTEGSGGEGGSGGAAEVDGGGGEGGDAGSGSPQQPGKQPPAENPDAEPADGTEPTIFAISKLFIGDSGRDGVQAVDAWEAYGFNLDGLISTPDNLEHCLISEEADAETVITDGPEGIDNSFGKNVIPTLLVVSPEGSSGIIDAIQKGEFSFLLQLTNLGAAGDQSDVEAVLYGGATLGSVPAWDGNDEWPILYESVEDGDIDKPKVSLSGGYVVDGTWVSGVAPEADLTLVVQGQPIRLVFKNAQVVMDVSGVGADATAANGVITGILETEAMLATLKIAAASLGLGCDSFDMISPMIGAASDIMTDGTQDPDSDCDGISIAVGFEAEVVKLGALSDPAPPVEDPCADE